jgi:hypothetical protein
MNISKDKAEEYETLKAENVDRVHISFSEFSLFNQCGHRHLLEKHLGVIQQQPSIHLYFGNAVHASLEQALKNNLEVNPMIDYFRATFTKDMMDNMKETTDFKNNFQDFLEQGEHILRVIRLEVTLRDYEIVAIEEALYEKLYSKYYFKGFIDLVVRHKITKRYKIIDWKTSGSDWDVAKKKKDETFLAQMRFYKFFWARKNNVPLDEIDCGYIVLNRLTNKKNPKSFPGRLQEVDVITTSEEIKISLAKMADTIKMIHIDKNFPKIKHTNGAFACMFCPLKGGKHPLCDSSNKQHKSLLKEYRKK